jgi:hypothetical protein
MGGGGFAETPLRPPPPPPGKNPKKSGDHPTQNKTKLKQNLKLAFFPREYSSSNDNLLFDDEDCGGLDFDDDAFLVF